MRTEMARMFSGRGFWLAVMLGCAAVAAGITENPVLWKLLLSGQFRYLEEVVRSRAVCFLLPVIAVLPWSDSFLAEWKSGFLRISLPRQNKRVYTERKVLTIALGGFLAWMAAGVTVLLLLYLFAVSFGGCGDVSLWMLAGRAALLLRPGLIAAILASLGGICAVLSASPYLAFGFPVTGYFFCIILQERFFPGAVSFYPPEWIAGGAGWGEGEEGLWLFLLLFLAVAAGIHGGVLYDKLDEI